jgi:hypothetical protein
MANFIFFACLFVWQIDFLFWFQEWYIIGFVGVFAAFVFYLVQ